MERQVYEFISQQTKDPIVEWKTCKVSGTEFPIYQSDLEFYDKISPVINGVKYQIPTPTLCPDERQKRRLCRRNERKLYNRKDENNKTIISMFAPDKPYKILITKEWFGDGWNALNYGFEFDFNKPFFYQFDKLLKSVPQIALLQVSGENCDYINFGGYNKNCYLCFDIGWNEDCAYLSRSYKCKNSFDLSFSANCENSWNLLNCDYCVNCNACINVESSYDLNYCYNCSNCNNCWMCSNLVNKQYVIYNTQYTKENYKQEIEKLKSKGSNQLYKDFLDMENKSIHKYANITSCENVKGDYLTRCKNCRDVYGAKDTEDCAYVIDPMMADNIYDDAFSGNHPSFTLETIGCENLSHSKFCFSCRSGSHNLMYCHFCHNCNNCFGCAGLKNKEYCIFNKQYTKEEYEKLVPKIIEHMQKTLERGEFFPASISPFDYNESLAQEYYPLKKEEALKQGFTRRDKKYEVNIPDNIQLIDTNNIPNINEINDDILKKAIICEVTGRPFRIIKLELDYYKKNNISIPNKHPDQRHYDRLLLRNPRELFNRQCDKCGCNIITTYKPENIKTIYCESCYNKEIYG